MWFCIVGALMCGDPGTFQIPGPLSYAPRLGIYSAAWNYAAYYGVPILDAQRGMIFALDLPELHQRGFTW
jgi:hypothetical protein